MSVPPEPPDRLAKILLEILALSNSTPASQSESANAADPIEDFGAYPVKEQPQRRVQEDNNGQTP